MMEATTLDYAIDRDRWFSELKSEYAAAAATNAYFQQEMQLFEERNRFSFYADLNPLWLMDHNERAGMYMLLGLCKPRVAIEIGARFAGTTTLFSEFAEHVYAIDIDPRVKDRCAALRNVTVLIGDSTKLLPALIERLNAEHGGWDLALVDGDHSTAGVRSDLNALVEKRPQRRAWIAMHDSFHPACRAGILEANWQLPWVQAVEVDFTIGNLMPHPQVFGHLWGGLALAEISNMDRKGPLCVTQTGRLAYEAALAYQAKLHNRPLYRRVASRLKRVVRGLLPDDKWPMAEGR
jgi:Methyltransferase domain